MPSATDICYRCGKRVHWSLTYGRFNDGFGPTSQRFKGAVQGSIPQNQSSADRARAFKGIIKVVDTLSLTSDPGSLAPLPVNSKAYVQFWQKISASPFITECIRGGYKIPFYLTPPTTELKNNSNTLKHSDFVQSAILELVTSAG